MGPTPAYIGKETTRQRFLVIIDVSRSQFLIYERGQLVAYDSNLLG